MKRLILPVFFAATAAVAVELKDPATVARDWQQLAEKVRQPIGSSRNLAGQSDDLTITPLERIFSSENLAPPPEPPARPRLFDAPSYTVPEHLPNIRPRGAVPWEYEGRIYWLVPLDSPGRK